ncbi:phage virion morphogenesis protein [Gallaecimonas kandeliae]|uniref:phage virion morphogenesis protein n=1 Tax=Gallaecimonas kandeliae TaxID=3029055 RepID=UPI002647E22B|nr:phage virion morphogenesis protein [Gallaecimonas kandeliae]WKE65065.1 phage virion morphogenesis protein [Gallaecimonas kandeliae]
MAGARIEIGLTGPAGSQLGKLIQALDDPRPLLVNVREYLQRSTTERFLKQRSPQGNPWKPLSPRYKARKKQNQDKILILRGYLMNTLRGVIDDDSLAFGTDRPYGAAMQFGATIEHAARSQQAYFKRNEDGSVGNRFVHKSKSDFAQWVTIGEHVTHIPARPWLGTSKEDDDYLVKMAQHYLSEAI